MSIGLTSIGEQPISSQLLSGSDNLLPTTIDYISEDSLTKTVEQVWPDEAYPSVVNIGGLP